MKFCQGLLFLIVLLVFLCRTLQAQWVETFGAHVSQINAFAVGREMLFAGTGSGVYTSTDGGQRWTGMSLTSRYVNSLIAKGGTLFAAVWEGKNSVYSSEDNGSTWVAINNGFPSNVYVQELATDGERVFAGTSAHGLFITSDNGANWRQANIQLTINSVVAIALDGANVLIATGGSDGVLRSTDLGQTWSAINNGLPEYGISSFAVHDSVLFAGSYYHGGIYSSTNHGDTWTTVNVLSQVNDIVSSGTKLFAGTWGGGVLVSEDGGSRFFPVNDGLGSLHISRLAPIGGSLFAGTEANGIWRRPLSELVANVTQGGERQPTDLELNQNFPNPFNSTTTFSFSLPTSEFVSLKVLDVTGKEVATLAVQEMNAGKHNLQWNAGNLSSGVYFYRLQAGPFGETRKLILLE
jgi:photosystem II stability/assembly factor-like uncharacterized protein